MQKSGDDGVSRDGSDDGAADPEVAAITRKFEESHDTLGAINDLQQLLIGRTGQIPVISTPEPEAEAEPEREPAPEVPAEEPPVEPEIDWTPFRVAEPANAPGFSPWIDPEQIAAARDDAPARTYSDVTTQVFQVFSAKPEPPAPPAEPEPPAQSEPPAEPEPAPVPEPEPDEPGDLSAALPAASAPLVSATESIDVTPLLERAELDEDDDDVIDETDRADLAVHEPTPAPAATPLPPAEEQAEVDVSVPSSELPPALTLEPLIRPAPEPEPEPKPRRRWWPFGRR